jgi:hypothetical protein
MIGLLAVVSFSWLVHTNNVVWQQATNIDNVVIWQTAPQVGVGFPLPSIGAGWTYYSSTLSQTNPYGYTSFFYRSQQNTNIVWLPSGEEQTVYNSIPAWGFAAGFLFRLLHEFLKFFTSPSNYGYDGRD